MPCAFKLFELVDPHSIVLRSDSSQFLSEGCQFDFEESELFDLDGKQWCECHLPIFNKDGNKTQKLLNDPDNWVKRIFKAITERSNFTTNLSGVCFPGYVNLPFKDNLVGPFYCIGTHFHKIACFSDHRFAKTAAFDGARFDISAEFIGSEFFGPTSFQNAVFKAADFSGAHFYPVDFSGATFQGFSSFEGCWFHRHAVFNAVNFSDKSPPSFSKANFKKTPKFHNCSIPQGTNFSQANFFDLESESAARAYQTLKLAMADIKATQDELKFYKLEQISLRKRKDTPFWEKRVSEIYHIGSSYGESLIRPVLCLLILTAVFWLLYAWLIGVSWMAAPGAAFLFSLEQIFRPFYVLLSKYPDQAHEGVRAILKAFPIGLRLAAVLQSLFSIGLASLFFLAVRRRFRSG